MRKNKMEHGGNNTCRTEIANETEMESICK